MKKQICVYIGVLLVLALIITGFIYAASFGNSPVIDYELQNTETSESSAESVFTETTFDLSDSTETAFDFFDPDLPIVDPESKTIYTEPTPEELLQELKDGLTLAPEKKAALVAEYDELVSERDAILAKESSFGLTESEEFRKREVDGRLCILRLQDIYPDIEQALEANFINTYEQMRLEEEAILKYRNPDESEINHAKAFLNLAIELETRYKNGEDVETLYLYFYEQVYALDGQN